VVGLEGNGPTSGRPRRINRIIASEDGVAVDAVFANMVGLNPDRVATLRAARMRGMGVVDVSAMDLKGEIPRLSRFKLPLNVVGQDFMSFISAPFYGRITKPNFRLRTGACTRCGTCAKGCPRGAIRLDPFPKWNYKRCIGCYCCYELCEQEAIGLASFFARFRVG
jgi:ferredoxin